MNTNSVVLIGGGGHAKVIADILDRTGAPIAGCVCPRGSSQLPDIPWLAEDIDLETILARGLHLVHIAIGDNSIRQRLCRSVVARGFRLASAISPEAVVSTRATLGQGVAVMPGVVVNAYARIGECAILNTCASVDHDCDVGAFAHVAPGCRVAGNVVIGEGSFIGTGCSIIPGMHVGEWSVLGAGSVVIQSVPDRVTAVGVPARVVKRLG
jgi:UDP-perosamine 4-acetyltransferase